MDGKAIINTSDLLAKGIRKTKSKEYNGDPNLEELTKEARNAIKSLQNIRRYYEFVTDKDLVEYAIYREKAEQERISYLLKRIKEIAG